jgi:hypothetical protein
VVLMLTTVGLFFFASSTKSGLIVFANAAPFTRETMKTAQSVIANLNCTNRGFSIIPPFCLDLRKAAG